MAPFQARYTCQGELQLEIVEFISRNALKFIIAKEHATREHIQVYLEYENTKKTWDNKFKLKFPNMDRRDKYFMADKGTTMLYVCKDNDIIAKRGFTDEDIQNLHTQYHQNNPKTRISLEIKEYLDNPPETKPEKVKKPRPPTFMMKCRNELEDENPELDFDMEHEPIVFIKVMDNLGHQCKNLDKFIVIRLTNGILNSLIKYKRKWYQHWYRECFGKELYGKDGNINIAKPEMEDEWKLEEELTAFQQSVQAQNEREEKEIQDRHRKSYFIKK